MSTKKTPRQSSLASFFKKTPSKESPLTPKASTAAVVNSSPATTTPTRQKTRASSPIVQVPTSSTVDYVASDEDESIEETLQSSRPRKRRKTVRLEDSDDDYCDSNFGDQDMLDAEAEAISSATSASNASNSTKARPPPPKIAFDLSRSSSRLASFLATKPGDPMSAEGANQHKPTLVRESSSRVSAVIPMSKQDQLVEGGYDWLKPGNIKDADGNKQGSPDYNPRTLYIPRKASDNFGNFEKQFWQHKSQNFDSIVFFQKGKFYELYEEDAVVAHTLFDWKMSGGRAGSLRMAGVPDYTFDHWAGQFVAKGYRVARVDQMESILGKDLRDRAATAPKEKIVRRELTQVLTQGTLVDGAMLSSDMSTFIMSLKEVDCDTNHAIPSFGAVFADTATGVFHYSFFADDMARTKLDTLISQIKPRELVLEKGQMSPASVKALKTSLSPNAILNWIKPETEFWDEERTILELREARYFGESEAEWPTAVRDMLAIAGSASAFGGLLWYLRNLKLDQDLCTLKNFSRYDPLQAKTSLVLDGQSLLNLDVFTNSDDGSSHGTLFELLNHCITPFGKRMFKLWVCHPLQDALKINERLDAVDFLNERLEVRAEIQSRFAKLVDLERIISRLHCGRCKVVDFVRVLEDFSSIMQGLSSLRESSADQPLLSQILQNAPDMSDKMQFWKEAFDWDVARGSKDEKGKHIPGPIIPAAGVEEEFDNSQTLMQGIEDQFGPLLKKYQKELNSVKVRYATIGQSKEIYQIEVPISIKVPKDWTRLSATKQVIRYWSPKVKTLVVQLLEARELHKVIVESLESRYYKKFDEDYRSWSALISAVATIDCLFSLAVSSHLLAEPNCRPEFVNEERSVLEFEQLRHPCVQESASTDFIPNDIRLGGSRPSLSLLTGPNMAGKSTLLRSTCIGVILAQLGHYVPAAAARLTAVDQVSVRTGGAKDNISGSQSTFMVELNETATILNSATHRSLVVLDELGRGTSTYDGMAIACSVLHYLATYKSCLGFFSTHYGNLTEEFTFHPEVKFQNMDFLLGSDGRDVTFLYRLVDGICSHSHGLNVARMAGIDESIIRNAALASAWFDGRNARAERSRTRNLPIGIVGDFERLMQSADDVEEESDEVSDAQVNLVLKHARLAIQAAA